MRAMNCENCQLFLSTGASNLLQLRTTYCPPSQTISIQENKSNHYHSNFNFHHSGLESLQVQCSIWSSIFCTLFSLINLMCVITCAHDSTLTTSLMRVKNSTCHFCLWHLLSGTLECRKWKKDKRYQIE